MKGNNSLKRTAALGMAFVLLLSGVGSETARAIEPEDNSSYEQPEEKKEDTSGNTSTEDMTGKVVIAVRKPVDFRVYSKTPGVFIVEAKHKGEITGYDIVVRRVDSDTAKRYRAMTKQNLMRRFVGGKANSKYKVKVRTFRTINGKDYPSKWTKELQVIVTPREDDGPPSSTTLNSLKKNGGNKASKKNTGKNKK